MIRTYSGHGLTRTVPRAVLEVTVEPIEYDETTASVDVLQNLNKVMWRVYHNDEGSFGSFDIAWLHRPFAEVRKRWLAAYAVQGGSEGHWVHIDTCSTWSPVTCPATMDTVHLFHLKTFNGYERAVEIANLAHFLLTFGRGA